MSSSAPSPPHATKPSGTPAKPRKAAGGLTLGHGNSREAQRQAAVILEVLAGARTPAQAATALGVSLPRYYQVETRALRGLVEACEAQPRGRQPSLEGELTRLRRQHEQLQRELSRQQSLVRLTQRNLGLTAPAAAAVPAGKGKKRRRRPTVRALSAATLLQERSSQEKGAEAVAAAAAPSS